MENYRQSFLDKLNGGKVYEEELLNMLLSNAYGGKDYSDLSKALLMRFPGVRAIIGASYGEIISVKGVTESIATYFKTLDLLLKAQSRRKIHIADTEQAFDVAGQRLKRRDCECMEIYFLNARGLVIDIKSFTSRKADRVDVEAGNLLAAITVSKAYSLYFAHNHIDCSASPSPNDDAATQKLIKACELSGVRFVDHIIVSSTGERYSYLKSGRLAELKAKINIKQK